MGSQCKLSDLSEGKIGKIQIMKSGKTRLVMGDIIFELSRGAPCGFLQVGISSYLSGNSENIR